MSMTAVIHMNDSYIYTTAVKNEGVFTCMTFVDDMHMYDICVYDMHVYGRCIYYSCHVPRSGDSGLENMEGPEDGTLVSRSGRDTRVAAICQPFVVYPSSVRLSVRAGAHTAILAATIAANIACSNKSAIV